MAASDDSRPSVAQAYPCPDCGSVYTVHQPGCEFDGTDRSSIERAYIDIIAPLSVTTITKQSLQAKEVPEWTDLHERVFAYLTGTQQVIVEADGTVRLATEDESVAPDEEPLITIYRQGTYPGCHDNGIFALVAYFSNMGLSWQETKSQMLDWFNRTGTWDRGGFEEDSPEEVIEQKRHVWAEGYGWQRMGNQAKSEIKRRS